MSRSWQIKRVVVTKGVIAIGRADDESETLLDAIPFVDIDSIREMLRDDGADLDNQSGKFLNAFIIRTAPEGHNCGRTYYLQAHTPESYAEITQHLIRNQKEAKKRAQFNTRFTESQYWVRKLFRSQIFQNFAALLITLVFFFTYRSVRFDFQRGITDTDDSDSPAQNFVSSILEAQFGRKLLLQDGSSTRLGDMMDNLNLFFTAYFTLELLVNAYANWMQAFIRNGWNHLDVFIVLMSLLDLGPIDIPDWFVKLVRAFRVIRLFGRISGLKKMVTAVTASIFPMMNAFVILLVVLSICTSPEPPTTTENPLPFDTSGITMIVAIP